MSNTSIKNICCIGAGYVGGPTMAVIANNCPRIDITVVDINQERINSWNSENLAELPIYEPGLKDIIKKCRGINLFFSTEIGQAITNADVIFISVNTPTKQKGVGAGFASDLKWIESSTRQIAKFSKGHTIVVEKSTLPVRTAETIKNILLSSEEPSLNDKNHSKKRSFSIISNPEFLAEGTAINDLQNPDRVLIGGEDAHSIEQIVGIYKNWIESSRIITTNLWSSELSKLVANAFLAQRVSSINTISALCEATGANILEVAKAIGTDRRIGKSFLNAGPGFGGSCFKKDILNLVYLCRFYSLHEVADYWEQIIKINSWQQKRITSIVIQKLFGTLTNKKLVILGFSYKANTNDTRESPSISISRDLLSEGAKLAFYDPKVTDEKILKAFDDYDHNGECIVCNSALKASADADAILILTEWNEFKDLNWSDIYRNMRKPSWIFDARAFLDRKPLKNIGFNIWTLGND